MNGVREKILAEIEKTNDRLKELRRQLRALSAIGEWLTDYPDNVQAPEPPANGEGFVEPALLRAPDDSVPAHLPRSRGRREAVES